MDSALERAVKIIGGKSKLAKGLGVHRQQVSTWTVPPIKYVKRISAMTGGKVSIDALMRGIVEEKAA